MYVLSQGKTILVDVRRFYAQRVDHRYYEVYGVNKLNECYKLATFNEYEDAKNLMQKLYFAVTNGYEGYDID